MKNILLILFLSFFGLSVNAQIGYQVSLLYPETGLPRANESVTVLVSITDSDGRSIISETHNVTTNEFGIISLQIGNSNSFASMDWSKLPLWVSASVNGIMIGKSQILNVPVAEHAKHTGSLTKEILCSRKWCHFRFYSDGSVTNGTSLKGRYYIDGNAVAGSIPYAEAGAGSFYFVGHYIPQTGKVYIAVDRDGEF